MRAMRLLTTVAMGLMLAGTAACTAEVEDEGQAPDVDVQGGEAPQIDVNPADVTVGTDTQTVTTPDVDVQPQNP